MNAYRSTHCSHNHEYIDATDTTPASFDLVMSGGYLRRVGLPCKAAHDEALAAALVKEQERKKAKRDKRAKSQDFIPGYYSPIPETDADAKRSVALLVADAAPREAIPELLSILGVAA